MVLSRYYHSANNWQWNGRCRQLHSMQYCSDIGVWSCWEQPQRDAVLDSTTISLLKHYSILEYMIASKLLESQCWRRIGTVPSPLMSRCGRDLHTQISPAVTVTVLVLQHGKYNCRNNDFSYSIIRDVMKFEFEFDNVRTSKVFNRFEIRRMF